MSNCHLDIGCAFGRHRMSDALGRRGFHFFVQYFYKKRAILCISIIMIKLISHNVPFE
jgi:hypothetical protein